MCILLIKPLPETRIFTLVPATSKTTIELSGILFNLYLSLLIVVNTLLTFNGVLRKSFFCYQSINKVGK